MARFLVDRYLADLTEYEEIYKKLHANPELSDLEEETATLIENHLRKLSSDLEIKTKIGGFGLVGICRNGSGRTVMLRADMDALPVAEKTGLEYASKKKMQDVHGDLKPVMHGTLHRLICCPGMLPANHDLCSITLACGHDFHVTSLLAAAETALKARSEWSGTIIFLFQPAEERGTGATAMVNDGLYDEKRHACPIPDLVLGQHVMPYRAGSVETKAGTMMSAADSFKVTIFGSGGHGSQPHRTIDPVVIASYIVVRLQTICSREVPPDETAVVTVGSIQAGDTENIIAAEAVLKIDIRTVTEEWRQRILDSVKRIVKAECDAGRCPQEPVFERTRTFPVTYNDEEVNDAIESTFSSWFKEKHKSTAHAHLASEDVSILASSINKPCCFWFFGGIDAKEWDEREKNGTLDEIPVNHSPYFAPVLQPTLKTGVEALSVAIFTFLGKSNVEQLHSSADM